MKRDPKKAAEWRRRGVENYRERLRKAVEAGKREWAKLNPVNRKRRAKHNREHFGPKAAWVRTLPCIICGRTPSQACHARSRGAGGTSEHLVPMCAPHHREQHDTGIRTFEDAHNLDLLALAADYHRAWLIRGGEVA